MSEEEAREWLASHLHVPRETIFALDAFTALLSAENARQNLVSRASLARIWARHVADSAQLLLWAPSSEAPWLDLGSGAGFPGLIVALLHGGPVTLVEERRLRVDFLRRAISLLRLDDKVEVAAGRVETLAPRPFDVISARAFAPLPKLFELGTRFSTAKTRWILPKGRNARSELDAVSRSWQGDFRLERSRTDPEAWIVIAERVKRKR